MSSFLSERAAASELEYGHWPETLLSGPLGTVNFKMPSQVAQSVTGLIMFSPLALKLFPP